MTVNTAVIGSGQWGKNHVRIYKELEESNLKMVSDLNSEALDKIKAYFGTAVTTDYRKVLDDEGIEGVSICVPASLHYKVAKEALEAGKNVLVEKPLTLNSKHAEELVEIAERKDLVLMTGQVFRFNPVIKEAKKRIKEGEFGEIYYLSLSRMGLKRPREDCGVIFNYAAHDFDMMCDILDKKLPEEITAISSRVLNRKYEDIALVSARFEGNILGYSQVSWLLPKKIRDFWVIGEKKSAYLDTMKLEMEIFEKGIIPYYDTFGAFQLITKEGDVHKPSIQKCEPLKEELRHFVECIEKGEKPVSDGNVGLRAVRMIEAALLSSKKKCAVRLDKDEII